MNTASLELCRELYALSGWYDTTYLYVRGGALANRRVDTNQKPDPVLEEPPAYELGYLIRKLPADLQLEQNHKGLQLLYSSNIWSVGYGIRQKPSLYSSDNTPENATVKLLIELFKSGVLQEKKV